MSINVAIVDDNHGAREGLAALVRMLPGLNLVAACKSGQAALRELPQLLPQVVLLEVRMTDMPGAECIRRLRARLPGVQIVVLSSSLERGYVFEAMTAGASGYLLKESPPGRILEAIPEVINGGSPVDPVVARMLVERFHDDALTPADLDGLSEREEEVLRLVAQGFRAKEIGVDLKISVYTVQTHVRNIYEKLEVRSSAEAVARYFRSGRMPKRAPTLAPVVDRSTTVTAS